MNIKIEKQSTKGIADGNFYHDGTFTDDDGNEYEFTVTEMKMNGSSTLEITWVDEEPEEDVKKMVLNEFDQIDPTDPNA